MKEEQRQLLMEQRDLPGGCLSNRIPRNCVSLSLDNFALNSYKAMNGSLLSIEPGVVTERVLYLAAFSAVQGVAWAENRR